jgi:hypothetical protein
MLEPYYQYLVCKMSKLYTLILILMSSVYTYGGCTLNISESLKHEYGSELQTAFELQSEGLSISAMACFEQGYSKAINSGEMSHKLEAIRKLFTWYRTYGHFLGLMKKDPQIVGQYLGNGKYSSRSDYSKRSLQRQKSEQDGRRRDYLIGVSEILSGLLCIWLAPGPYKAVGSTLIIEGANRAWDAANASWVQKDISMQELQRIRTEIKAVE